MTLQEAQANPFVWPGGYVLLGIMDDGEYLCNHCLNEPEVHEDGEADGWRFEGADVYWEGPPATCAHCYKIIESEYGDPNNEGGES